MASTKVDRRILAESIACEFEPRDIFVAYFVVEDAFDTPRSPPILALDKADDSFAKPSTKAEEIQRVAHKDRPAWSFNVDLRLFGEA